MSLSGVVEKTGQWYVAMIGVDTDTEQNRSFTQATHGYSCLVFILFLELENLFSMLMVLIVFSFVFFSFFHFPFSIHFLMIIPVNMYRVIVINRDWYGSDFLQGYHRQFELQPSWQFRNAWLSGWRCPFKHCGYFFLEIRIYVNPYPLVIWSFDRLSSQNEERR